MERRQTKNDNCPSGWNELSLIIYIMKADQAIFRRLCVRSQLHERVLLRLLIRIERTAECILTSLNLEKEFRVFKSVSDVSERPKKI